MLYLQRMRKHTGLGGWPLLSCSLPSVLREAGFVLQAHHGLHSPGMFLEPSGCAQGAPLLSPLL